MLSKRSNLKVFIVLLTFLYCWKANAQDVDRKRVDIDYIRLPLKALPSNVETYYVSVKPKNSSWGNALGNVYDAESIKFNGYHRLQDASDADVSVESEVINDLVFDKAEEKSVDLTYKKDKNSPEIKYTAYYYYITYYTPKIRYSIRTKTGKPVAEDYLGGGLATMEYGSTNYSDHFSNLYSLSAAWRNEKSSIMAKNERDAFQNAMGVLRFNCLSYTMCPAKVDFAVRYVDEKKGKTLYADLREARDYYIEAVSAIRNDKMNMINKLVQPDYETRKENMMKAIVIWEKALAEADFDNKKARIDSRVGRHLYYNLALGYLWIDDFAKAKEYAQGRKKDIGSWDKNLLAGIKDLSTLIDDRAARQEANKWRTVLLKDSAIYAYKDPATRQKEHEALVRADQERLASEKRAIADSIKLAKSKKLPAKKLPTKLPAKKRPALKRAIR